VGGTANIQLWESYLDSLRAVGKDPAAARINLTGTPWLFVSDDPERMFARLAPGVIHWVNHAAKMASSAGISAFPSVETAEDLRRTGQLTVVTPAEAVTWIKAMARDLPVDMFQVADRAVCQRC
jgi:hypothetical protein